MAARKHRSNRTIKSLANQDDVFLNLPYDADFSEQFLAYICGVCAFGLLPRATLELQGGTRRLDRIVELIQSCRYSIHDLSRVELDKSHPPTPRFNMPFELGLAVLHSRNFPNNHTWFLFESVNRRVEKSLSDLKGTDAYIHTGTPQGVFRELAAAFVRRQRQPTVEQMLSIYMRVTKSLPKLLSKGAAHSPFSARAFQDIVILATTRAEKIGH